MRKRFLLPLPCALLASFFIWELRYLLYEEPGTALRFAWPTAMIGMWSFPVGLAVPWLSPRGVLKTIWPWISLAGYGLYLGLSLMAWKRSSLRILAALVLLLVVNVISCQVQAPAIQKAIGLE